MSQGPGPTPALPAPLAGPPGLPAMASPASLTHPSGPWPAPQLESPKAPSPAWGAQDSLCHQQTRVLGLSAGTHLHEPHPRLCPQRRCPQPPAREQARVGSGVAPATPAPSTARSRNLLPSHCSTDHLPCESPSGHLLTATTASSLNPIPLHSLFGKGPVSLEMTFPVPRPLSFQTASPPVPAFSACLSWFSASPCAAESRPRPRRQHSVARASVPAFSAHSFPFSSLADPSASPTPRSNIPRTYGSVPVHVHPRALTPPLLALIADLTPLLASVSVSSPSACPSPTSAHGLFFFLILVVAHPVFWVRPSW